MIKETVNCTTLDFRIKTRTAKGYTMNSHHFHDAYEIYYMNAGSRDYFLNDTTHHVNQGDLVLVKPQDLHKTMDTGVQHSRVLISFRPAFLPLKDMEKAIEVCFATSKVFKMSPSLQNALEECLKQMIITADKAAPYYLAELQCLLANFLILIARNIRSTSEEEDDEPLNNDKVHEITQYLKTNYNKPITLYSLAEEFYLSRYYLTRVFKKTTGFTIFEYLHSIRVIEAQRLLRDTSMKIIQIAQSVGFSNVANFGKVFKSITGFSPTAYRKQHQVK